MYFMFKTGCRVYRVGVVCSDRILYKNILTNKIVTLKLLKGRDKEFINMTSFFEYKEPEVYPF